MALHFTESELEYATRIINGAPLWSLAEAVYYAISGHYHGTDEYLIRLYELIAVLISSLCTYQVLGPAGWAIDWKSYHFLSRITSRYNDHSSWHAGFCEMVAGRVRLTA